MWESSLTQQGTQAFGGQENIRPGGETTVNGKALAGSLQPVHPSQINKLHESPHFQIYRGEVKERGKNRAITMFIVNIDAVVIVSGNPLSFKIPVEQAARVVQCPC